jgi:2-dehydropantoate 2-reductase
MNRIFIIGSGAIGKVLAVFLKHEGRDVVILRGSADNIRPYFEAIEVECADGSVVKSDVEISTLSHWQKLDGMVVLTNKTFGNAHLATTLSDKIGSSPIVLLQNGLNIEQPFLQHFSSVYRCVLFATSQTQSTTNLRFRPVTTSPIGIIKGSELQLEEIVNALHTSYFSFNAVANIQEIIWRKVIANCVFNSICPLLNVDNGIFHRNSKVLDLAKIVIDECIAIAQTVGIKLTNEDIVETVLMISKSSDGQLISTLQDLNNGRETEIESLNLAIAAIAAQTNKIHLVPTTKLLGELVLLKSKI